MRWAVAAVMALLVGRATAATAYVSDELILGVYAEDNGQGQRLATLHSGAILDTLGQTGEYTQVRLADGTTGWVKSAYLTTKEPATVRLKLLEDELDRTRATTPALAEAAAHNEVLQLKRELYIAQSGQSAAPAVRREPAAVTSPAGTWLWIACSAIPIAAGFGYWLGYATLARRVRNKFGGIKVY